MTTLFFLFSNIIILFKLLLICFVKLFMFTFISKSILISLLIFLLYLLKKYPRRRFKKLSQQRKYKFNSFMKYAMKTKKEHVINLIILFMGFCIFFICIILLRFYNIEKNIDLLEKKDIIYNLYLNTNKLDFFITCLIFVLIFILYILNIIRLGNYFKFHLIKRHIYLVGNYNTPDKDSWYVLIFLQNIIDKINIYNIHNNICDKKIPELYKKFYFLKKIKIKPENWSFLSQKEQTKFYKQSPVHPSWFVYKYNIDKILYYFLIGWHYFLLLLVFFYDIFYNNYNIQLIFMVLPWTLFFDFYLRISKFFNDLDINYDIYINTVIYGNNLELINKDTFKIDGEFYDLNNFKKIYETYILRNFIKDVNKL